MTNFNEMKFASENVLTDSGSSFAELPVFADGNCGFYVVGTAMAAHIRAKQFPGFTESKFEELLAAMREKNRIDDFNALRKHYDETDRKEIVPFLDEFKNRFLDTTKKVSFNDFVVYVQKQTSREQIAALSVAFAPGLRQIAVREAIKNKTHFMDAAHINKESIDATYLTEVCHFFDLDLQVFTAPNAQDLEVARRNQSVAKAKLLTAARPLSQVPGAAKRPVVIAVHHGHQDRSTSHFNALVPHETLMSHDHVWHEVTHPKPKLVAKKDHVEAKAIKNDVVKSLSLAAVSDHKREYQIKFDELIAKKAHLKFEQLLEQEKQKEDTEKEINVKISEDQIFDEALIEAISEAMNVEDENNEYAQALQQMGFFRHREESVPMEVEEHVAKSEVRKEAVKVVEDEAEEPMDSVQSYLAMD